MIKNSLWILLGWLCFFTQLQAAPELQDGLLVLPQPITFSQGSDAMTPESSPALEAMRDLMSRRESISMVRIDVHVAEDVNPEVNQALSEKRAQAVARWLVDNGVRCVRIVLVGFGSNKPVGQDPLLNTRVEVRPIGIQGHLLGGTRVEGGGLVLPTECN